MWYDDQQEAHRQIYGGDEVVDYAFMGTDPNAAENRWLREAMIDRIPTIYFLGTSPGLYQPIIPTFVVGWDLSQLKARLSFGLPGELNADPGESVIERRYALRQAKVCLHQATFRAAVIAAYGGLCAISGLPQQQLRDAAHIAADGNEKLGQPIISNGLPLSKLHHAPCGVRCSPIGVSPDCRVVVADRLLSVRDGPTVEAPKQVNGSVINFPARAQDRPNRDRLAMRFEQFRNAT